MTNQEQYEIIWDKANKYDKLIKALDKIIAEIKDSRDEWIKGQDPEWYTYDRCLQIIDKYRESEVTE
jgi:hypothetical protein